MIPFHLLLAENSGILASLSMPCHTNLIRHYFFAYNHKFNFTRTRIECSAPGLVMITCNNSTNVFPALCSLVYNIPWSITFWIILSDIFFFYLKKKKTRAGMMMQLHNPKFSPRLSLWIYYVLICLTS